MRNEGNVSLLPNRPVARPLAPRPLAGKAVIAMACSKNSRRVMLSWLRGCLAFSRSLARQTAGEISVAIRSPEP